MFKRLEQINRLAFDGEPALFKLFHYNPEACFFVVEGNNQDIPPIFVFLHTIDRFQDRTYPGHRTSGGTAGNSQLHDLFG